MLLHSEVRDLHWFLVWKNNDSVQKSVCLYLVYDLISLLTVDAGVDVNFQLVDVSNSEPFFFI